ncbi:MAG: hypothetical protein ACK57N_00340 [Planctomycetia bacterium]|jgi:hypothetical protein
MRPTSILLATSLVLAACQSEPPTRADGVAVPRAEAPAWTTRFMGRNVLMAAEVRIEGPKGLLDHLVTRSDPSQHDIVVQTVPAGFLQQYQVKGGRNGEIRAQLDQVVVVATRKLSILERPGEVPVVVHAAGDVYYKELSTGQELRQAALTIEGRIGQ